MSIVNQVSLIGCLICDDRIFKRKNRFPLLLKCLRADAEVKTLSPSNRKMANFSVATDASYANKQTGEWVKRTDWHRITIYQDQLVNAIGHLLVKGRFVAVIGELKHRSYEDGQGNTRHASEVIINSQGAIKILDNPKKTGSPADNDPKDSTPPDQAENAPDAENYQDHGDF
ncbi:MAG: single-stranded DNA-binding protein [Alphaproteobacteria bacterium]